MDLSVIITTTRVKCLPQILHQFKSQSVANLKVEPIVVVQCEDNEYPEFLRTLEFYGIGRESYYRLPVAGDFGGTSRNFALQFAKGEFSCFWDDDVIFYPHALTTLYATAYGLDVGFAACFVRKHRDGYEMVPRNPVEVYGPDTMCFCVRTGLAKTVPWPTDGDRFSDTRWMAKLLTVTSDYRTVPVVIGITV